MYYFEACPPRGFGGRPPPTPCRWGHDWQLAFSSVRRVGHHRPRVGGAVTESYHACLKREIQSADGGGSCQSWPHWRRASGGPHRACARGHLSVVAPPTWGRWRRQDPQSLDLRENVTGHCVLLHPRRFVPWAARPKSAGLFRMPIDFLVRWPRRGPTARCPCDSPAKPPPSLNSSPAQRSSGPPMVRGLSHGQPAHAK